MAVAVMLCALLPFYVSSQDQPKSRLGSGSPSPTGAEEGAVREIQRVLDTQVAAWNRGDLEGFMAGYWHSPDLTFFSNDSETRGWEETLERYKQRYQGEGHAMGVLDFQSLRITPLGEQSAFARGQFHLKMPDGKEMRGMFTLVFRKFPNGWKIVHDHSSA